MKNASAKKWLDIALLILFFVELGGMFLPAPAHELIGCGFLLLVVLHNAVNRHFYENFFRGENNAKRWANKLGVLLFGASLFVLALSGVALSQDIFRGISFGEAYNWRSVHMGAAIAAFILLFAHLLLHAGRYIQGRSAFAIAGAVFVVAAAGIFGLPYLDRWFNQVHVEREKIVQGEKVAFPGRVLTVYFSRVGNTDFPPGVDAVSGASVMKDGDTIIGNAEMIAYMAHDAVGGDIFAIRTEKTYPADYGDTTKEGKREIAEGERPALREPLPKADGYDVIVLVYPLWWHTLPMAVESFLEQYDLTGKTIVPIVTHGGGGKGDSLSALRRATNATIVEDCLDVYSSDIPTARQAIAAYLKKVRDKIKTSSAWYEESVPAMGATLRLKAEGTGAAEAVAESAARAKELESLCGTKNPDSDVSRLNAMAGQGYVPLHDEVYHMLEVAQQYAALSDGAFDVTIGPLSRLWREARKAERVPAPEEVAAARKLVGWEMLHLRPENRSAFLALPGMAIDLGGLAKGFVLDEARRIYQAHGVENGLIDFGSSSICALGHNPEGEPWNIGLRHPRREKDSELMAVLPLSGAMMSTSGDYERRHYFLQDGRRYHHIIDPRTGYPTGDEAVSATVTLQDDAPDAGLVADILSTASFVMGAEQGGAWLRELDLPVQGAIIDGRGQMHRTGDFAAAFPSEMPKGTAN